MWLSVASLIDAVLRKCEALTCVFFCMQAKIALTNPYCLTLFYCTQLIGLWKPSGAWCAFIPWNPFVVPLRHTSTNSSRFADTLLETPTGIRYFQQVLGISLHYLHLYYPWDTKDTVDVHSFPGTPLLFAYDTLQQTAPGLLTHCWKHTGIRYFITLPPLILPLGYQAYGWSKNDKVIRL